MTDVPSRLRLAADTSPAAWLEAEIDGSDEGVRALLPGGFAAYARVLHPADSPRGEPVRWHEAAAWAGRSMHPRVQFAAVSRPVPGAGDGPPPWDEPPRRGELPAPLLSALCAVLARHTAAADRCWFCLWSGWGWIGGTTSLIVAVEASPDAPPEPSQPEPEPAFDEAPRVRLPWRDYVMFEGPLDAATELGDRAGGFFFPQSPNLFWPDDRAWCVATEIDLDSTYVGGPAGLVADLLADPALEVVRVEPTDPIDEGGDEVNRGAAP